MKKRVKNLISKTNILKLSVIISCLVSIIVFTYFYVRNESPIYIFDYSGYFENFKYMGSLLSTSFKEFVKVMVSSIRSYDYNYSSVLLLMPFYFLVGSSRFSYILSLTIVYVFPSILLMTYCFLKIIGINKLSDKNELLYALFTILIVFMYTRIWSPTLRGLSDICGFVPIIISYILIRKRPLLEKQKAIYPIILGLVVYLPFLFRRWYIYYIIGFFLSSLFLDLFEFFKYSKNTKTFWTAFKNYFIFGITIILLMLFCQLPLIRNILGQNYSEAYAGYQTTFCGHLISFYNEFGLVIIILIMCGLILSLIRKKYYKESIFAIFNIIFFWILFGTVQNMGVHHYLGISFWVMLLVYIGIRNIYELFPKYKTIFLSMIVLLFAINFMTTFIFRDRSIPLISQNNKYYKFRYNNFDELERLISDAENLLKDKPGIEDQNSKISVLAESSVISDNLLDLLGNVDIKDNIFYATHIDSRDGINFNSFFANYIIVTSESQLGTNPRGQYVIDVPNKMIYNGYGLGKAYERISGPYNLDQGVRAYIYKKTRQFTKDEVDEYFEELYNYYPEWQEKYSALDKMILSSNIYLGANYGTFKKMDDDTYFFYPGITETLVDIPIDKKIKSIDLKLYVDYKGNNEDAGIVNVKIKSGKKVLYSGLIDSFKPVLLTLELEEKKNLLFEIDGGENLQDDWLMMDISNVIFND